ncbi:FMN binding oxidoreductase [Aspergillus udagawae]|nr:FMN binding oxidoreductase [Aspergillus udagawae]
MASPLSETIKLPCGLVLSNRLCKAAMAEMLGGWGNKPTPTLLDAYKRWSRGQWGAILTGNVQVDVNNLGTPFDPALHNEEYADMMGSRTLIEQWSEYAATCQEHGTPCLVQLCHPGRQSLRIAGRRGVFASTVAPSSVPLQMGGGCIGSWLSWLVLPPPREMTRKDIERVTRQFIDAARLMASNRRTDEYGGSARRRAKFVVDIIREIREVVPANFCIGIKMNSTDHQSGPIEETMEQIRHLIEAGIDFLEISGGSYERPTMVEGKEDQHRAEQRTSTMAREAFFIDFAIKTRKSFPNLVLMLTGGFRSRSAAEHAIKQNACDLIGIGRPASINPEFAKVLLDRNVPVSQAKLVLPRVDVPFYARVVPLNAVGAGWETLYYVVRIFYLAKGWDSSRRSAINGDKDDGSE